MKYLAILTTMLCLTVSGLAQDRVWVQVDYIDQDSQESYYMLGQVDEALYQRIVDGTQPVHFITLHKTCYFEYTEDGNIRALLEYEDAIDTDVVTFPIARVLLMVKLKRSPYEHAKAIGLD